MANGTPMLPRALGQAQPSAAQLRDLYTMQALSAMGQDVDPAPYIAEARRRADEGDRAMLNALAANFAGERYAPMGAQYLRKAMAARAPLQVGNAGFVSPDGQFIKNPTFDQQRRVSQLTGAAQFYGGAAERETAAAQRAQDRADGFAKANTIRIATDPITGQSRGIRALTGEIVPIGGGESPRAAQAGGKPGFAPLPPLKLTDQQAGSQLFASNLAASVPQMETLFKQGYRPTRQDLFAVGPMLSGMANSFMQEVTPRSFGSAQGRAFYEQGLKALAAILRKESGGAITEDEWTQYGPMYLPWPGDSEADVQRKLSDMSRLANQFAQLSGPAAQYYNPLPSGGTSDEVIDLPSPGQR